MRKKRLYFIFVCLEVCVTALICSFVYQKIIAYRTVQSQQYAAVIPKSDLIYQDKEHLKHYYEMKPGITEQDHPAWLPYTATYTFNNDGLNDRKNYVATKSAGTYRILALGDSFTFGHYVSTKDSWPEKLEEMLNARSQSCERKKFEVLNLGMRGFDIPYIVERYKSVGEKYDPDLIIWLESGSGFTRVNELEQDLIEECEKKKPLDQQKNNPGTMYSCWTSAAEQIEKTHTKEELRNYFESYFMDFFSHADSTKTEFFTFSSLPSDRFTELQRWMSPYSGVKVSNSIPDLAALKDILPDGHPNNDGHEVIAKTIYTELLNGKLATQCATLHPLQPK